MTYPANFPVKVGKNFLRRLSGFSGGAGGFFGGVVKILARIYGQVLPCLNLTALYGWGLEGFGDCGKKMFWGAPQTKMETGKKSGPGI